MNTTSFPFRYQPWLAGMTLIAAIFAAGCNRDNVKVYHVEKDDSVTPPPVVTPAAAAPNNSTGLMPAAGASAAPQLTYTLPTGWQETAPGQMRVASFSVANPAGKPADVGVIPMPAGPQDIQLVNMWRQQMQLPATTDAEADKGTEDVSIGDASGKLFDIPSEAALIDGKSRARILVAMTTQGQTSWFFKMVGEESFVESQKSGFLQFLKSVSFTSATAPATPDMSQLPPSHPAVPGLDMGATATAVPAADAADKPTWTVPAGWQEAPLSQFLIAKYTVAGTGDAKADINISSLANEGGGVLPNVNRWRRQLGLDAVTDNDLPTLVSTIDASGVQASVVDFTGTDAKTGQSARLIGVILPLGGQTWFYKLMGDNNVVAQQKDAFTKFIQSAKYPDAH
jgi:hypothetical protein